jgi:hypothetical protein
MEIDAVPKAIEKLTEAINHFGAVAETASVGLQVKMDKAAVRLGESLDGSIAKLIASMDTASAASTEAARAANRYAWSLVAATWALVFVTVVLVIFTAWPTLAKWLWA